MQVLSQKVAGGEALRDVEAVRTARDGNIAYVRVTHTNGVHR
jgi:hypothetical protein